MTTGRTLYVINPNSLVAVTKAIERALDLRHATPPVACLTVAEGPPGIVTEADVEAAVAPLTRRVDALQDTACGFVIACYSDPGLQALRGSVPQPVWGIGECGLRAASAHGRRIGVIAISSQAIGRHYRYYASLGFADRLAGERAIDMSFADSVQPERAMARMTEVGRELRDLDGADVLLLGCATMGGMRAGLEDALGMPVVDPCRAAVDAALARLAR